MPLTWRQLKGQIEELPESALDQIALVDKFELYNEDWVVLGFAFCLFPRGHS